MSAARRWALQQAVYARLVASLAGQGPGGADVPVYDHVPKDPPRLHARIDGFNIAQRNIKADKTLHAFNVHLFDRPTGESAAARGQKLVAEVQSLVIAALHEWSPAITGATEIRHGSSDVLPDEDGLTQHGLSRFSIYLS